MAAVMRILLFSCILTEKFINAEDEIDFTLRRYCYHPPNFGEGEFDEKEALCTVEYNVTLSTDESAFNFCEMQSPFTLDSIVRNESQVICKIKSHYRCDDTEILIGNVCFYVAKRSQFTKYGCGRLHKLHVVKSTFEQKWIAAFMPQYKLIWVANDPSQLNYVHVAKIPGETMDGVEGRMIDIELENKTLAIITVRGSKRAIPVGRLTYVTESTSLPLLCSRNADILTSYVPAMVAKLREVGINSYTYQDRYKQMRPFYISRQYAFFETIGDLNVSTQSLHGNCKGFLNGYVASPFDFNNTTDFKKLLKKEDVNVVATTGRRYSMKDTYNLEECKGDQYFKSKRGEFRIDFPDGTSKVPQGDMWRDKFPDRTCADAPRVALGFSQEGLVDLPVNARLFTVCTFGRPFKSDSTGLEDTCHQMAHYDKDAEKCICDTAKSDILETTILNTTEEDKANKPGTVCLDCEEDGGQRYVVLFDLSGKIDFEKIMEITGTFVFSAAKTQSKGRWVAYGDGGFSHMQCYEDLTFEFSYDGYKQWENENSYFKQCYENNLKNKNNPDNSMSNPELYLRRIDERNDWYNDAPKYKRLLIFVTSGRHRNETELSSWLDKYKENNVKIVPIGVGDGITLEDLKEYASNGQKPFHLKTLNGDEYTRELYRAMTHVDQLFARNACIRI